MSLRAAVVGSGPNGLSAACMLARSGARVTVFEAADSPGGGLRSAELFGSGLVSDLGASVHPLSVASPVYRELLGGQIEWAHPPVAAAHGCDGAEPVLLHASLEETAAGLGEDAARWHRLIGPVAENWEAVQQAAFTPVGRPFSTLGTGGSGGGAAARSGVSERLSKAGMPGAAALVGGSLGGMPQRVHALLQLGSRGGLPASSVNRLFRTERARALFTGLAAHSSAPLSRPMTSAFGVLFAAAAHAGGWPVVRGGTGRIADALVAELESNGGHLETGYRVTGVRDVPLLPGRLGVRKNLKARGWRIDGQHTSGGRRPISRSSGEVYDVVVLDLTPAQVLKLDGLSLIRGVRRAYERWDYGPGTVKIDLLLDGPIPWEHPQMGRAGTVHLGGSAQQIAASESAVNRGVLPGRPYVLLAQPAAADDTRTPDHRTVAWAYAHVPFGLEREGVRRAVKLIEDEISRYAPGFRDVVIDRKVWGPAELEAWNANLVGGALSAGLPTLGQMLSRPARPLAPYTTGVDGIYLCSASTPPGGGAHGMAGHNAAVTLLRDLDA